VPDESLEKSLVISESVVERSSKFASKLKKPLEPIGCCVPLDDRGIHRMSSLRERAGRARDAKKERIDLITVDIVWATPHVRMPQSFRETRSSPFSDAFN